MLSDSWRLDRSTRCWRWNLFPQINRHRNILGLIKKVSVSVYLPVCSLSLSVSSVQYTPHTFVCLRMCTCICLSEHLLACSFPHMEAATFLASVIWVRVGASWHKSDLPLKKFYVEASHTMWPFWMYEVVLLHTRSQKYRWDILPDICFFLLDLFVTLSQVLHRRQGGLDTVPCACCFFHSHLEKHSQKSHKTFNWQNSKVTFMENRLGLMTLTWQIARAFTD